MRSVVGVAAFVALAMAKKSETIVHTVTTYLPFEQHSCASMYVLGNGQPVPPCACEAGACCLSVEDGDGSGAMLIDNGKWMEGGDLGFDGEEEGEAVCHGGCRTKCTGDCDGQKHSTRHITETIKHNVTSLVSTVLTTEVASYEVVVTSTTVTSDAIITTETEVEVTKTTTNSDGQVTTETTTTESPITITTPITTVVEITTTEEVVTEEVVTTTVPKINEEDEVVVENILIPPIRPKRPPPEEDPTCPFPKCQAGVEMALFKNPFESDHSGTYDSLDPSYFKKAQPIETSVTTEPIFINDDNIDGSGFNPKYSNAAAGYRGFMFACQDGTYRFESPYSDDITIMWFGKKAYSGYTKENADIIQFYYGNNKPQNVYREIKAGTYYPIRVLWGNTGGAADLSLRIYAPDGRELSGIDEAYQDYITTEACDGSYQPFAPWGDEP